MPGAAVRESPLGWAKGNSSGFTLIELIIAIGIFSVLMTIVTTVFLRGIQTIELAERGSSTQTQQQNAMEWISRLVRYADNPVEGSSPPPAITEATSSAMTFTTFSGTGPVDRVPYQVRLVNSAAGITSQVWTPTIASGAAVLTNGLPTYTASPRARVLVASQGQVVPNLAFRYWTQVDGVSTELIPPPSASLTASEMDSLSTVDVVISDPGSSAILNQTVYLVNPR